MQSVVLAGFAMALATAPTSSASAQKSGGILKIFFFDSPATMSIHEESTIAGQGPMMGVFNNLVMYDQSVPQSGMKSIVPDLAREWSWDAAGTNLTFKLRRGIRWHDGKPFTAGDVNTVIAHGDDEVTFKLRRPQPAFIALLASGFSPVYPCHVPPAEMRRRPIGTGPFKFVEFKPNELIRVARNPNYWKPGRPYLDGIEYIIIKNQSTGALSFVAGTVDMTSPYFLQVPMLADIKAQVPQASCAL